jgi:hypothetical protein
VGKTKGLPSGGSRRRPPALKPGPSIEQLIRDQGVQPVHDLDELGELFPADCDPEDLLNFIERERRARRAGADARGG